MTADPMSGARLEARLKALAEVTATPGAMTRLTLSPEHRRAVGLLEEWFHQAGMTTILDGAATLIGRHEGAKPGARTLLIGSHIDTVRDAGIYDGNLGVVMGLALVEALAAENRRLPFAIEVCAFGDEEGVRFPSTLTGSLALAGRFDQKSLDDRDEDGVTRRAALADFGAPFAEISKSRRDPARIIGYFEVHIEQGPVLEADRLPVGIVSAINGGTRGEVRVHGMGGHAGTLPMKMRHEALAAAAEMILAIEARGRSEPDLVATVGAITVPGQAINVVAGDARFSLDVRAPSDAARRKAVRDIVDRMQAIATGRGVEVSFFARDELLATTCDTSMSRLLGEAVRRAGVEPLFLPSGAGHDAMAFRGVLPVAMLFVRCRGGISHNPAEYASPDDISVAMRVLHDFVTRLKG